MPQRLLDHLTEVPRSGQALAERLGVGRVSVHNLARALIEEGVPVLVTRRGYALAPGTPTPGQVPVRGRFGQAMRYLGTTGSTQDAARAWADDAARPAPHGAVVIAERQTVGRGRRGRPWISGDGHALTFSVLLRGLQLRELTHVPLAAGVALQEACKVGGLKWPNDLLAPDGRKMAGVLLEADVRGEEARHAVLGVGLNVTAAPPGAAHLGEFRSVSRAELLAALLWSLEGWLARPSAEVLAAWRAVSCTLGREVTVTTAGGVVSGQAVDLDDTGSLLVRTGAQTVVTVGAGDVALIGALPAPSSTSTLSGGSS